MKSGNRQKPSFPGNAAALADTCHRILQAALAEFAERGLDGARVDRIAQRANVNKALLYYHFGRKDHLYEETLTAYLRDTVSAIRLRLEDVGTLEEALVAVAVHYRAVFLSRPEIPRLILRELANPHSILVPRWAESIRESGVPAILRRYIDDERQTGHLRAFDPAQALVSFITMQIGYYLMSPLVDRVLNISDHREFVRQRSDAVVDLFLHGVKTR